MVASPQSTNHFEIEIKSLLGSKQNADQLRKKLESRFPNLKLSEESSQLNHYFVGQNFAALAKTIQPLLPEKSQARCGSILKKGKKISVRTRQLNEQVILVMKASIDDTTSSNGISRLEFETEIPNLTLKQLDQLLLDAGFTYQAKWSRQRQAFQMNNMTVCIDKNAGYGYLAEFEALVNDSEDAETAKEKLRQLMSDLGVTELPQDRLERMFAFYNAHWPEYYGTERVFTVK